VTDAFVARLPGLRAVLDTDIQAAFQGDPAARSADETLFCYPGVSAIIQHRIAHELFALSVPLIPRMISELAHSKGIPVHMDGARIFNAATALGVPASEIAKYADSVTFCVSKGLAAPVGSVLCGTRDFVRGNRFWCVLVALEEGDDTLVGVAHFPLLGETYWAERGSGAYCNDDRLHTSAIQTVEECVVAPGGLHRVPEIVGVRRVERHEQQASRVERPKPELHPRRHREHGRMVPGAPRESRRRERPLRRLVVGGHDFLRGALHALEGTRDEIASLVVEVDGLAGTWLARVGNDCAVEKEAQAAVDAALQGEVPVQKSTAPPIADRHAAAIAEVVLGVASHEDAMPSALGSTGIGGFCR
jgi:hypothetical protein